MRHSTDTAGAQATGQTVPTGSLITPGGFCVPATILGDEMKKYGITGRVDGHYYGIYEGDTPEDAVRAMMIDAGADPDEAEMSACVVEECRWVDRYGRFVSDPPSPRTGRGYIAIGDLLEE